MQCGGGDYALVTIVGILGCIGIAVLYVAAWRAGELLALPAVGATPDRTRQVTTAELLKPVKIKDMPRP